MKKIICASVFLLSWTFVMNAQSSLSVNYMYIGSKEKYGVAISNDLVHHGIGVQSKIRLKNRFHLMPDIGYFFADYEKINHSGPDNYSENKAWYFTANVNLGYAVPVAKSFSILPLAGIGYFHEFSSKHMISQGVPPQPGLPPGNGPFDILVKDNAVSIVCNIGFNMELYLTKNIFLTAGLKYMLDIYDTKYNAFPYINAGIGYSF